jgi:hypothetical protein
VDHHEVVGLHHVPLVDVHHQDHCSLKKSRFSHPRSNFNIEKTFTIFFMAIFGAGAGSARNSIIFLAGAGASSKCNNFLDFVLCTVSYCIIKCVGAGAASK